MIDSIDFNAHFWAIFGEDDMSGKSELSVCIAGDCCGARMLYGFPYRNSYRNKLEFDEIAEARMQFAKEYADESNMGLLLSIICQDQYEGMHPYFMKHGWDLLYINNNSDYRGSNPLYTYALSLNDEDKDYNSKRIGFTQGSIKTSE